ASDRGVLSLVSCALGKRREETRSSAGGVEALALKKKKGKDQRKNWIPACAGMTSECSSAGGVEALALKKKKGKDQRKNWIPACAGMTSECSSAGGVEALALHYQQ